MNKLYFILVLMMTQLTFGQVKTVEQVIKNAIDQYLKQDYATYGVQYASYKDYTTGVKEEDYTGFVVKYGTSHYAKVQDLELISVDGYGIQISHNEKYIAINKGAPVQQQGIVSILDYLKGFQTELKETDKYYICVFTPATISQVMVNKVEVKVDKKTNTIKSQSIYFTEEVETKNEKGESEFNRPRMVVNYVHREKNMLKDKLLTIRSHYFSIKNNKIVLTKQFADYQLYTK